MLDLNSPKWKQLEHAYGAASDIPALLRQLPNAPGKAEGYQTEPWFSLWSSLCHQGDIYTVSYAAVPHIVAYAALRPPQERWEFISFVAFVEVCRNYSSNPPVPPEFESDYFAAVEQMRVLAYECAAQKFANEVDAKVMLGSLAALNGFSQLGNAILQIPEPGICPNCDVEVLPVGYELP